MMYRVRDTGQTLSRFEVQQLYPNTSFPSGDWDQEVLNFANIDTVLEVEKPKDTEWVEYIPGELVLEDNQWKTSWVSRSKFTEEQVTAKKWSQLREERDKKLNKIDLIILKDAEMKALGKKPYSEDGVYSYSAILDLIKYKQELRNFPSTISDINNIMWPFDICSQLDTAYKEIYNQQVSIDSIKYDSQGFIHAAYFNRLK